MGSINIENFPNFEICPRCNSQMLENALYCGKCGISVETALAAEASGDDVLNETEVKSLWQWVSSAILLWISLLSINLIIGLFGHIFDLSNPYFDLGAVITSALLILIPCVKARKQLKPLLNGFGYRGSKSYLEIVGVLVFLVIFIWLYFFVMSFIGVETISYLSDYEMHSWPIWSAFILLCLFPGIFEELAFRGYIMTKLEKVGKSKEAIIIQAAMFSLLHMLPAIFISHFIIGLILGIVRIRSQSLYPCIIIHISYNSIVIFEEAFKMGVLR